MNWLVGLATQNDTASGEPTVTAIIWLAAIVWLVGLGLTAAAFAVLWWTGR